MDFVKDPQAVGGVRTVGREYVGSGLDAKLGGRWKQMGTEEKKALVDEEMKKMQRLPPNSSYASHRLRVLNKIHQLLSLQRNSSQDEELELLFSSLRI